ncbi:Ig-like domain-containing protein [Tengunoibacter tsumagoiensis]|uniref:Choice-of-anchor D domain-containing protein n=1 Tax=Tengunoibacter tsumagoiensis TaxID=2014871 RepID=A0A402A3L5_9CHLR|nr:PQQ-binding-like beta-propeller repeat protein [Tengunoibacter tsumagoiensis]GCE13662.1 hypothetical protein KTT_35210 [Tengunoibacter tsumagoiensis]
MSLFVRISAILLLVLLPLTALEMAFDVLSAKADVITQSHDDLRTGWYSSTSKLTPVAIQSGKFGQTFATSVVGQVYAQPLVADGVLLVVTEANNVYGLDPKSGKQLWMRNVGIPFDPQQINCTNIVPSIGITGTPVIDPVARSAYFVAKTYVHGNSGPAQLFMHSIDIKSGIERKGFPVLIQGKAANDPSHTFGATLELQRPGLVLTRGVVYAAFGGHCDEAPYEGWVAGVSTSGQLKTLWTDEAGQPQSDPEGPGAGIWTSGVGLLSDGPGQILFSTGNGKFPALNTPGKATTPKALGQSVVRLTAQNDGSLKATDFFAPYDADLLDDYGSDVGSGAPMELPPADFGTHQYPRIAIEVTKQGYIYLLDANNLGGRGEGIGGGDAAIQRLNLSGGMWGRPGVWPGDGGYVYMVSAHRGEGNGVLQAYRYLLSNGRPTLLAAGTAPGLFGFGSTSPIVTSAGDRSGSALVWVIWTSGPDGKDAQLRAYDPVPVDGTLKLRYSFPIGTASKFNSPIVYRDHVYLGTRDGQVMGFGLFAKTPQFLTGDNLDLGNVAYGKEASGILTITAVKKQTITNVTLDNDLFHAGRTSPALPARLLPGQQFQIPITLRPGASANLIGMTVSVESTSGTAQFGVVGFGQPAAGRLTFSSEILSLGGAPLQGQPLSAQATLTNTTATPVNILQETLPVAPFHVDGLIGSNGTLAPGESSTFTVRFTPDQAGYFKDKILLQTSAGQVTLPISASAG